MNPRKPRCCEICNKTFKRHENLVLHQNKAKSCEPATKLFKCQYCNEGYRSINGLKYHVKKCGKNINDSDSDSVDDNVDDNNVIESNKYLIKQLAKKDAIIEKLKDEKMKKMENYIRKLENDNEFLKTLITDNNTNNKINDVITNNTTNGSNTVNNNIINNTLNNNTINNTTINNNIHLTDKPIEKKDSYDSILDSIITREIIMDTNTNDGMYVTKLKQCNENDLSYDKKVIFTQTILGINFIKKIIEKYAE